MSHDDSNLLSVLSYNIHKGMSYGNFKNVLTEMRVLLREIRPDFVFLQEIHGEISDPRKVVDGFENFGQLEFLADEIWPHYSYGQNAVYRKGCHGNAILSKYPIIGYENHDISTNQLEKRGVLHAEVDHPEGPIHLFCTHFNLLEKGRTQQVQVLASLLEKYQDQKVIVAGDFNDLFFKVTDYLKEKFEMDDVFRYLYGKSPKTFPVFLPLLSLDRIFSHNLKPLHGKVLKDGAWGKLSDHAALFCELCLK
ncbi:MAG: endonuclease/exonuclease/phosphatase family protein [Bacteriovoracaceae bacterium]